MPGIDWLTALFFAVSGAGSCALTLWSGSVATAPAAQDADGKWAYRFQHLWDGWNPPPREDGINFVKDRWEAAHMSLIPTGPYRGSVVVWGGYVQYKDLPPWKHYWSIVRIRDAQNQNLIHPTIINHQFDLPVDSAGSPFGDIFCSGHSWMADGRMFVAGGSSRYPPDKWEGSPLAYLFDPGEAANPRRNHGWTDVAELADSGQVLEERRWYPTTILGPDDTVLVLGGVDTDNKQCATDPAVDTYEVWDPSLGSNGDWQKHRSSSNERLFAGPAAQGALMTYYARMHLLTTGDYFMSGMADISARLSHVKNPIGDGYVVHSSWEILMPSNRHFSREYRQAGHRLFGSSVLAPGTEDVVICIGGQDYDDTCESVLSPKIHDRVQFCRASASLSSFQWLEAAPLGTPRYCSNAVILPDESIFYPCGMRTPLPATEDDTRTASVLEGFNAEPGCGRWRKLEDSRSRHCYHMSAILLPDARVIVAGGESTLTREWDYEIFEPPYLFRSTFRPVIEDAPAQMQYFGEVRRTYTVSFSLDSGDRVHSAVLIRPGSTTHHSDFDQRLLRLKITRNRSRLIEFLAPETPAQAPRGWYMLFVLTHEGVPSEAAWVILE